MKQGKRIGPIGSRGQEWCRSQREWDFFEVKFVTKELGGDRVTPAGTSTDKSLLPSPSSCLSPELPGPATPQFYYYSPEQS